MCAVLWAADPARAVETSTGPVIGEIRVRALDIFDPAVPGEDNFIFRAANKIHITTREQVIRRELLLKPGDPFEQAKVLESERNIRAIGFFRKAEIKAVPAAPGRLDLDVLTQDSWTTIVQFSVGTEGGEHFFIYGAEEKNLLGYNKSLGYFHSQVGAIVRNDFRYVDPRFLGSRYILKTIAGSAPGGQSWGADLTRPFFALDTSYAAGTDWSKRVSETLIYRDAVQQSAFISNVRTAQASAGLRLDNDAWFVSRVLAGWYSQRSLFTPEPGTTLTLPADRELSGPTAGYSWVQPRYVKESFINTMERVEDFNLGNEFKVFGGYMGQALGSDRDRLIFNVMDQQGLSFAPGRFILAQAGATGRGVNGNLENAVLFANANLFWKTPGPFLPQTWVFHAEVNATRLLDAENQIVLGGNNGLRGYRNFSFTGNKSVLLNLENRSFFPGELFHLFRVGGALFFDAGSVVPENGGTSFARFHSDVGLGLRFSPTRSTGGRVVRADVAYALNGGPGTTRWVVSIKGGQAFDIFNSATRTVKQSPSSRLEPGGLRGP